MPRFKKTLAVSGLFGLFVLSGSVWLTVTRFLPDGMPRSVFTVVFGVTFVGLFAWLIVARIREVLSGVERLGISLAMTALEVALLIVAFAWMYQMIGILDSTGSETKEVTDFMTCVYYSVVTFTTLGYGDFYPTGPARVLAALEAFTGYIILGVLASTASTLIAPSDDEKQEEEEEDQEKRDRNSDESA